MTGHTGTATAKRGPRITGAACLVVLTAAAVAIPALLGRPVLGERPGVAGVVLGVPLLAAAWAAGSQWRAGARTAPATRALGWVLFAVAGLAAIPMALTSYFFQALLAAPDDCAPIPVPGGGDDPAHIAHCAAFTGGETAAAVVWSAVIAVTLGTLVACPVLGRRSPTAALGSIPVAVAGCVMALDLAHLCAVLGGTG